MKNKQLPLFALLQTIGLMVLFLAGAAAAQAPTFQPVGSVRQLMLGIVAPTSDVIFKVPNKAPKNDQEWTTVQNSALILAETGNLLMLPGRAKDRGEWMKNAKALVDAGSAALSAGAMMICLWSLISSAKNLVRTSSSIPAVFRPTASCLISAGIKVTSYWATADMVAYYPETVKGWIDRHGGLTADMKMVENGPELWAIIDPCPEEVF